MQFIEVPVGRIAQFVVEGTRCFKHGDFFAMVSPEWGRWHLSLSHRKRTPTWDELMAARDQLLPTDIHFCVPVPQRKYWVNLHPYCLHIFEIVDKELTDRWEREVSMKPSQVFKP